MHLDSGLLSWITDYKGRPHFVCVVSSVSDRDQSSTGLPWGTLQLPTTPVKSVQTLTLPTLYSRVRQREMQNSCCTHSLWQVYTTLRPTYLKFQLKSPQGFFFFKQREGKINTCLCFCCLIELHSSIFCPFNGSNPVWKRKGNVPLFICTAHTIIYL